MPAQRQEPGTTNEERSKRLERANRILDAAAELVQRWGYRKTTIDDIAKQAGVAKGTIYLHWKTRSQLFETLLLRERLLVADDLMQNFAQDPESGTLHGITKHTFLVTMQRPLTRGILLQDTDLLGELLDTAVMQEAVTQKSQAFISHVELLRRYNLVRDDLDNQTISAALSAIILGFMVSDSMLPEAYRISLEANAEILAETVRRTFEPAERPSEAILHEVHTLFQKIYSQFIEQARKQLYEEMEQ